MSLINDALKRASQSDRNRSAQARLPRPMQPVMAQPRTENSWLIPAIIVIALCLAVAGWSLWKLLGTSRPAAVAVPVQPAKAIVAEPPPTAAKPAPIVQQSAQPVAVPVAKRVPTPVATAASAPALAIPAPEMFPTNLTVKAIFYSETNPRALINGKTVETGDKIGDVLVTGILSNRVFVDWKGQSKVIMMGGQ
jgi:hypothetical protein